MYEDTGNGNTSNPSLRAAALEYARNGRAVFGLQPGSKEPFGGTHGFHDASTDPATVEGWWSDVYDDANIGERPPEDEFVIDVDVRNDGYATLADRIIQLGPLPGDASIVRTPTAGRHIRLSYDGGPLKKTLGPGVDIKRSNGYVVNPPSVITVFDDNHPSGLPPGNWPYTWEVPLNGKSPRPSDAWLACVTPVPTEHQVPVKPVPRERRPDIGNEPWVTSGISAELDSLARCAAGEVAPGQRSGLRGRNNWLNAIAVRTARLALNVEPGATSVGGQLWNELIRACEDNYLVDDDGIRSVEKTIKSAFGYADRQGPAAVPEPKGGNVVLRAVPDTTVESFDSAIGTPDSDPIPLTEPVPIPPFPVDAFPEVVANMIRDISEAMQTDPAMAGTCAISALSGCAGGHVDIEIRPGWREPLNTFTAITAEPGERKSAVQLAMSYPLNTVEQDLIKKILPAHQEGVTRRQIAEKKADKARTDAANCKRDFADRMEAENAAIEAVKVAADIPVPPIPRLIADDTTPEAAATLLAEQKGRIAIISAEGGIFDILAGRYARTVNLDVFLKGHSGDPIRIDRKGRPPEHIPRPTLTVGLMIQPAVLRAIGANKEFRGRGLLARFWYALPTSKLGRRKTGATSVSDEVTDAYNGHIAKLAEGLWDTDSAVLTLTSKAREAIQVIEEAVEPQLADDGELAALKDWGAKYVGAIARVAGLLHLAKFGSGEALAAEVDAETIRQAHRIGQYFKACAINVFIEMGTDAITEDAVYLWERIKDFDVVSERDMQYACRARFTNKAEMMPALTRLVDHGYLARIEEDEERKRGRQPSPRYTVNTPSE
jgi:replicative DNA helicase